MGLSDHSGPLEIPRSLALGLDLLGFALKWQGLLKLPGDIQPVEVSWGTNHRLPKKANKQTI